jgi:hypothetical protein
VADVAELADALDSKFHFRRFQGVSSRFTLSLKTIDFIGRNALQPRRFKNSIQLPILSQLLSQFFCEFPLKQFEQTRALIEWLRVFCLYDSAP